MQIGAQLSARITFAVTTAALVLFTFTLALLRQIALYAAGALLLVFLLFVSACNLLLLHAFQRARRLSEQIATVLLLFFLLLFFNFFLELLSQRLFFFPRRFWISDLCRKRFEFLGQCSKFRFCRQLLSQFMKLVLKRAGMSDGQGERH